ncbi:MAG: AraC family transcriptional regulator [Bacilli bacterium]
MPDWLSDACQRAAILKPFFGAEKIQGNMRQGYVLQTAPCRYMNCTPRNLSMTFAVCEMAAETSSFSTGEISEACGFSDLPYFCRKFRDKYDCTPTQFRRDIHSVGSGEGINTEYKMKNLRKISI